MNPSARQPAEATREQIIEATVALLETNGASALTVSAIMERAAASRTAFYRQFDDVHGVIARLLESIVAELDAQAGDWFTKTDAVGRREVIYENALRDGRAVKQHIKLLSAIFDASRLNESLRALWRRILVQPQIDATSAAIRRDQAAGAIRPSLDPDTTALALTLMGIQLALEVLGRQDGRPEEYAAILTPIWEAVLFGA